MNRQSILRFVLLLVLGLLFAWTAHPSQAQEFAHWEIVQDSVSGTATASWTDHNGFSDSITQQVGYPAIAVSGSLAVVNAQLTVTRQTTIEWVDYYGNPAPNPPSILRLKVTESVDGRGEGNVGFQANADDGLGDAAQYTSTPESIYGVSNGTHLYTYDGTSGQVIVTTTSTSSSSANSDSGGYAYASVSNFGYGVEQDLRSVSISSSLDTTYHQGNETDPYAVVANMRQANGALTGDTSKVGDWLTFDTRTVVYSANLTSNFAPGSHYHWWSGLTNQVEQGTFDGVTVPDFSVTYNTGAGTGLRNQQDYIHIHIIDASDGANAENIYLLTFHDYVTDWVRINPSTSLPTPLWPSIENPGTWTWLGPWGNDTDQTQTYPVSVTATGEESYQGTLEQSEGFEMSEEGVKATFQEKEGITIGTKVSGTVTQGTNITVGPGEIVDVFWGWGVEQRHGQFSGWGLHGYTGRHNWTANVPMSLAGAPVVKFAPSQRN